MGPSVQQVYSPHHRQREQDEQPATTSKSNQLIRLLIHDASIAWLLQAIVGWLSAWGRAYSRVMSWESPLFTGAALAVFLYLTLIASAEYVLASAPFAVLVAMAVAAAARLDGQYVRGW